MSFELYYAKTDLYFKMEFVMSRSGDRIVKKFAKKSYAVLRKAAVVAVLLLCLIACQTVSFRAFADVIYLWCRDTSRSFPLQLEPKIT